jgi:ABC-type glycerol-3-phosphate transport system permease component
MRFFLIANPPPSVFYGGLLIGVAVVAAILAAFLGSKHRFGWHRLLGLCVLALILGPLAGASLAGLAIVLGGVNPLDRWWLLSSLTILGTVAGVMATILMGIIGGIRLMGRGCACRHEHGGTAKSPPGSA